MPELMPVVGYKAMQELLKSKQSNQCPIYLYFFGTKDQQGQSWCSDCNAAEETIMSGIHNYAAKDALVLVVDVGDRTSWKDLNNEFRKPPIAVDEIPTLLRWNSVQRLAGSQLLKDELLQLFFEDKCSGNSSHHNDK